MGQCLLAYAGSQLCGQQCDPGVRINPETPRWRRLTASQITEWKSSEHRALLEQCNSPGDRVSFSVKTPLARMAADQHILALQYFVECYMLMYEAKHRAGLLAATSSQMSSAC
jgi:hypothetical protein